MKKLELSNLILMLSYGHTQLKRNEYNINELYFYFFKRIIILFLVELIIFILLGPQQK